MADDDDRWHPVVPEEGRPPLRPARLWLARHEDRDSVPRLAQRIALEQRESAERMTADSYANLSMALIHLRAIHDADWMGRQQQTEEVYALVDAAFETFVRGFTNSLFAVAQAIADAYVRVEDDTGYSLGNAVPWRRAQVLAQGRAVRESLQEYFQRENRDLVQLLTQAEPRWRALPRHVMASTTEYLRMVGDVTGQAVARYADQWSLAWSTCIMSVAFAGNDSVYARVEDPRNPPRTMNAVALLQRHLDQGPPDQPALSMAIHGAAVDVITQQFHALEQRNNELDRHVLPQPTWFQDALTMAVLTREFHHEILLVPARRGVPAARTDRRPRRDEFAGAA